MLTFVKGWENIRSIYLKSENSLALLLFQNEIISSNLDEYSEVEIAAIDRKKQMQANLVSCSKSIPQSIGSILWVSK